MMEDYYEILQVSPNASPEVISAAYRRLARVYHPDTSNQPNSVEQMKKINHAYEILSDSVKRREYDRWRSSTNQATFSRSDEQREKHQSKQSPVTTRRGTAKENLAAIGALMTLRLVKSKLQQKDLSEVRYLLSLLQSDPMFSSFVPEAQALYVRVERVLEEIHDEEIDKEIVDLIQDLLTKLVRKIGPF